jgi:Leucine-rich repeat (LRR) protein
MMPFADAVAKGSFSLEYLDLSNNAISDDSIIKFAKSLTTNKSLLVVNLKSNQITKDGGSALRECIGDNKFLVKLFLEHNAI